MTWKESTKDVQLEFLYSQNYTKKIKRRGKNQLNVKEGEKKKGDLAKDFFFFFKEEKRIITGELIAIF